MRIPTATYRLQFNRDFRFDDAQELVDYLYDLGISDVYASPIFKARSGSMHGYDVVDHGQVDPALGGEGGFTAFSEALRAHRMGLILDIVPNHMGIAEASNVWWLDVLENGPSSSYAAYFDIDWQPANPHLENKVLLPILEDQYGTVLEDGKLRLAFEDGAFFVYYLDTKLPIAPRTYATILAPQLDRLSETLGKDHDQVLELQSILTAINHLPLRTEVDQEKLAEGRREKEIIKRRIASLSQASVEVRNAVDLAVQEINGKVDEPQSFDSFDALLEAQPYRLAFWRVAEEEINYRRFFDINELAAIRTETPEVFEATHQLILRFLAEGKATGLRVDHPDGLWDPTGYFHRLEQNSYSHSNNRIAHNDGLPVYVVAEKILAKGESLPENWGVSGTTGYDFLNQLNGLFVRRASRRRFNKIYGDFIGSETDYRDLVNSCKKMIMLVSMASEINALGRDLDRISERNRHYRDFTLNSLTFALREVIACLNIYRTYTDALTGTVSDRDQKYVEGAVAEAKKRNPRTAGVLFDFVKDTLLLKNLMRFRLEDRRSVIDFVMQFQQVTGPVMAKGAEDTAFYVYNRLVSLNEVGGDPEEFGGSLENFHRQNRERQKRWPHSMLTLTTHDTKRSEDVRARINVLSEIPADWKAALDRWSAINTLHKTEIDGELAPDPNDEYLLYQTLLGTWSVEALTPEKLADYRERIAAYMQKAIKEAKVHTSWVNPNDAYVRAVENFVTQTLSPESGDEFMNDFSQFHGRIAYVGMLNSLAQTLLKMTAPGVPDFYQGTELWDLSLVDPDNRRPVDYAKRRVFLNELKRGEQTDRAGLLRDLLSHWQDGRVKQYLIYRTLNFRREQAELFQRGSYLPLFAAGKFRENICAFARRLDDRWVIAMAPRLLAGILPAGPPPLGEPIWEDGVLPLPHGAATSWHNILTGESLSACTIKDKQKGLPLQQIFRSFPVALVQSGESAIIE
jgi:(1->4)-alpha-D-glucan 1-alpha-D-glucosylmutase